jgi:murein DD-endopeptidase MepM/ murein hydrolase activator NlpD
MAKLCYPWPPGESIRSEWGMRKHPITGKTKLHRGVDVGYNGHIYAPADGVVVHKGASLNKRTGGGYTLILRHDDPKIHTAYYHLREPSKLPKGAKVKRGEVIGHTGTTGASTGIHLHFETRKNRAWGSDFDPESILGHASPEPVKVEEKPKLTEDGLIGRQTWGAVQRMLKADGLYGGRINGVPGASTVRGLQKYLNRGGW